jgi:alpha/beta superfamily hydrolase
MTLKTQRRSVDGPAGRIEVALDIPAHAPAGLAFVGHPHPLYGGTLDNKVAATLARAFVGLGWLAVRPNFRGVGESEGAHDHGGGETDDFVHLVKAAPRWLADFELASDLPVALAGFSFGSFVAAQAAQRLAQRHRSPDLLVLVGVAAGKWDMPAVPANNLLIHGEHDETIPLAAVLDWARPQGLPVIVLPGTDHFFHRRLSLLKRLVQGHVLAERSIGAGEPNE